MLEQAELRERRRRGTALLGAPPDRPPLAVLSTFNLDLLPPVLAEALDRHGVGAPLWLAGFGQLAREIADPASALYVHASGAFLLVPAFEDLVGGGAVALAEERASELRGQVDTLLERSPAATVYVVCFGADQVAAEHVLSPLAPGRAAAARFDAAVRELAAVSARVVVVDWDWHVRGIGRSAVADARFWYSARMRLNPLGLALLADLVAAHVAAQLGVRRRKVAVVDLDDTLWGGVVGEVGPGGLAIGGEGVGLAFQDFQRALLRLHDTGVVLAACSKNNAADAHAGFERPEMVLRREHLAAERIDWRDKATGLREIASELNLGLDSLVFLDDSPVEREWVRQALPEVTVPELPADPVERPAFLASGTWFQTVAVTEEDRKRSASYPAEGGRRRAHGQARSYEEFLASLEQVVTLEPINEHTLQRAAQLCNKTNQFNLTTRRHSVAGIEAMLAGDAAELYTLAVRDRYGDSGITGVGILRRDGDDVEIDTLLLSCRVLGRRVEDAFLAFLARRAAAGDARRLIGRYEPTDRNGQVERFYADRGFTDAGGRAWSLDLREPLPEFPPRLAINETVRSRL
jgi:FkbH-like protein